MKLYGSQTSPYVRKIRLLFLDIQRKNSSFKFDFHPLNISGEDREKLKGMNPILKIPFIEKDGQLLYESRVILNEMIREGFHPQLDWRRQNLLSVIDALMDTLINRLLLKRSNVELSPDTNLGRSYEERISISLSHLEKAVKEDEFKDWDFASISLYSLLDWSQFRELCSLENFPRLRDFIKINSGREDLKLTDPRLTNA